MVSREIEKVLDFITEGFKMYNTNFKFTIQPFKVIVHPLRH